MAVPGVWLRDCGVRRCWTHCCGTGVSPSEAHKVAEIETDLMRLYLVRTCYITLNDKKKKKKKKILLDENRKSYCRVQPIGPPLLIWLLKVSLHIRGLLRVFTPPETLHENALFALIDL